MVVGLLALTGVAVAALVTGVSAVMRRRTPRRWPGTGSPPTSSRVSTCPPLPLQEVRVLDVSVRDGRVLLTVLKVTEGSWASRSWTVADQADPAVIAQLEGWRAQRSTLLLFTDDEDNWQLLAPDGTTTGVSMRKSTV